MLTFVEVGIIIVLFIVLMMILTTSNICSASKEHSEAFDVYFNHDMGAYDVYRKEMDPDISVSDAILEAKYTWRDYDKRGQNYIDKFYEDTVLDKNMGFEPSFVDSGSQDLEYDTKFSLADQDFEMKYSSPNLLEKDMYHKGMYAKNQRFTVGLSQKMNWA
jgi:hypothetical protein